MDGFDVSGLENVLRAEAEEAEQDAARLAARARHVGAVAFDSMSRGDRVTFTTLDRSASGTIRHAATDLAVLETSDGSVDVNLGGPVVMRVSHQAQSPGKGRTRAAQSFIARLTEYELTGEQVTITAPLLGLEERGQIAAVANDHIAFVTLDEHSLYIPFAHIAFIIRTM